jgi:hypothetical protein
MQVSGDHNLEKFEQSMDKIAKSSNGLPVKPITQKKLNAIVKQFNIEVAAAAIEKASPETLAKVNFKLKNILASYQKQQSPIRKKVNDAINKIMCKIMKKEKWGSQSKIENLIKTIQTNFPTNASPAQKADYGIDLFKFEIDKINSSIANLKNKLSSSSPAKREEIKK